MTFTYNGDEKILNERLKLSEYLGQKYPEYEIHYFIADDANNPFSEEIKENNCIHYFKTKYNRGGNLNGMENFIGQVQTLKAIQDKYDFDYVIKLDSDTCLINLSVLEENIDYGGGCDRY